MTTGMREAIWNAAYTAMGDFAAVVVTYHGGLGWLVSGRYMSRDSAFRAQRAIMSRNTNSYVVTRGRGDNYVIWLDKDMTA